MRKAWLTMAEAGALEPTQPGGKIPPFPGLGTMKAPHANRMTIDRVFAERRHISKMVGLYGFLFVAVWSNLSPSFLTRDQLLISSIR